MTTLTYAATRGRGEGTNTQPCTHANTHHVNVTVSSLFCPEIPRNHDEALELDWENDNRKWADSENLELSHLKALEITTTLPPSFKYTIKHVDRYKCRAVIDYPRHYGGEMSTVDRGANDGVAGKDMRLHQKTKFLQYSTDTFS